MRKFIDNYWEQEAIPTLMEFGKIPNESPEFAPNWEKEGHMGRAVALLTMWVQKREIEGLQIETVTLPQKTPTIFIEIKGDSDDTVLLYGHYDKQPGMEDQWREGLGPWTPVREGDLLYGRGIVDDGYSLFAALGAIEAAQKEGASLPRIVMIVEGSEESGSIDLPAYLEHLKDRIGNPKVVITLDADTRTTDTVWFTQSLRGMVNGTLTIETLKTGIHSGIGTGMVPSAFRIMRMLLGRFEDPETGTITNPKLNPPITPDMEKRCEQITEALGDCYITDYGVPENLKPSCGTLLETVKKNLWESGLEITGIDGLPTTALGSNLLAPKIAVKVSLRISPSLDADEAVEELKRVLEEEPPYGAKVSFTPDIAAGGWLSKPFSEKTEGAIETAAQSVYGTNAKGSGIGASIPFIGMMAETYPEADNLVIGVLTPTSHEHGPDENMHVPTVKNLTEWLSKFLIEYGQK